MSVSVDARSPPVHDSAVAMVSCFCLGSSAIFLRRLMFCIIFPVFGNFFCIFKSLC